MNIKTKISRLLRQEQTKAEEKLWKYLRDRRYNGLKFRRQHPIKNYIVDFINIENQIIIELDGKYNNDILQKEKDELRDIHLETLGYKVLRFENKIVFKNPELIFNSIKKNIKSSESLPLPQGEGWGEGNAKSHPHPNLLPQGRRDFTVLSTKKLSTAQKELLLNSGIGFVEYNAIEIELLPVNFSQNIQNAIFTSKNAVRAVFNENSKSLPLLWERAGVRACCVGENTKKLLEENGLKVVETAQNASDLGEIISKNYKNEQFFFFCGNLRRDELPSILKENNIQFEEVIVYKTHQKPKKFDRTFDGIFFFSPSGIYSYTSDNIIGESVAFCIGNTTASEAKKYTNNIIVANKPTVENVIVQAVKYFDKRI
ncbi:DUF559 domain-containing protein [Aquimarina rubra]|uniref:DUF559 domain-containing protein n=1 Tax=Aquimarina rubra TaxID=1920033 RepID=A0ABW5LFN9_9FLAO